MGRDLQLAADADREAVGERLRRAAREGRLSTAELEQRLELSLAARRYGELDALVADLPATPGPPALRPASGGTGVCLLRGSVGLAILGLMFGILGRGAMLVHEAHGMGPGTALRGVGVLGLAHAAAAGLLVIFSVLVLVVVVRRALARPSLSAPR
jgi:hypothetical protein